MMSNDSDQKEYVYGVFANFTGDYSAKHCAQCECDLYCWDDIDNPKYTYFIGIPRRIGDWNTFVDYFSNFLEALAEKDVIDSFDHSPLENTLHLMPVDDEDDDEGDIDASNFKKWKEVDGFEQLSEKYQILTEYPAVRDRQEVKKVEEMDDRLKGDDYKHLQVSISSGTHRMSLIEVALETRDLLIIRRCAEAVTLDELQHEILKSQGGLTIERAFFDVLGQVLVERSTAEEFCEFLKTDEMGVVLKRKLQKCQYELEEKQPEGDMFGMNPHLKRLYSKVVDLFGLAPPRDCDEELEDLREMFMVTSRALTWN